MLYRKIYKEIENHLGSSDDNYLLPIYYSMFLCEKNIVDDSLYIFLNETILLRSRGPIAELMPLNSLNKIANSLRSFDPALL